jgi:chromosome segregation ATPase
MYSPLYQVDAKNNTVRRLQTPLAPQFNSLLYCTDCHDVVSNGSATVVPCYECFATHHVLCSTSTQKAIFARVHVQNTTYFVSVCVGHDTDSEKLLAEHIRRVKIRITYADTVYRMAHQRKALEQIHANQENVLPKLEAMTASMNRAETRIGELSGEKEKLLLELSTLQRMRDLQQLEIDRLNTQNADQLTRISSQDEEIAQLRTVNTELTKEKEKISHELNELQFKSHMQHQDLMDLTRRTEEHANKSIEQDSRIANLRSTLKTSQEELNQLIVEYSTHKGQCSDAFNEQQTIVEQKQRIITDLSNISKSLEQQLKDARTELKNYRDVLGEREIELERRACAVADWKNVADGLDKDVKATRVELTQALDKVNELQGMVDRSKRELMDAWKQISEDKKAKAEMEATRAQLQSEVNILAKEKRDLTINIVQLQGALKLHAAKIDTLKSTINEYREGRAHVSAADESMSLATSTAAVVPVPTTPCGVGTIAAAPTPDAAFAIKPPSSRKRSLSPSLFADHDVDCSEPGPKRVHYNPLIPPIIPLMQPQNDAHSTPLVPRM